jgi:signal transduction histidine kinase
MSLRVLLLEDAPTDAELVERELQRAGLKVTTRRVDSHDDFVRALEEFAPDLVLSDFALPHYSGQDGLALVRARDAELPFIFVSGAIGEDVAVEMMKSGATDYVLKDRLASLPMKVDRALREAAERRELLAAEARLRAKEEELRAMTGQLWQTAKLATMGELAASVAHELNNPLTTVSLHVEWLLERFREENATRHVLVIIDQEVERMGNLVTNLLQFSRRGTPEISTLDLPRELDNSFELIEYHLSKRSIVVVRDIPEQVPMINADRQKLRQLFLNLFANASDAMAQGGTLTVGVKCHVTSHQSTESQASHDTGHPSLVTITIADTGVGISTEDLPKVTEPLFTTKEEGKSTGLGLAICKRIVEEHRGTLTIDSELGKGTRITITLPIQNVTDIEAYDL